MSPQNNLKSSEAFFHALETHDKETIETLLAEDVIEVVPFSNKGTPEPYSEFHGKEAVVGYLATIIDNFSRTVLVDKIYTVSEDGNVIFIEAQGDLVQGKTGTPYRNTYVFKHVFHKGKIVRIYEYANPITFAKLIGDPLG